MDNFRRYIEYLKKAFQKMPQVDKNKYTSDLFVMIYVGTAVYILIAFYPSLPYQTRVFIVPITIAAAWVTGKLVAPRG